MMAKGFDNMPIGKEPKLTTCAEILMERDRQKKNPRSYIFVEGLSDMCAVQNVRNKVSCTVEVRGNKEAVIELMQRASVIKLNESTGLDGIVGIVDRDFDHFLSNIPALPSRTLYLPDLNDLESIVMRYAGDEILAGLVLGDPLSPWFAVDGKFNTIERLVRYVVAPIGALRVAWRQEASPQNKYPPKLDPVVNGIEGSIVDRIVWDKVDSNTPLSAESLWAMQMRILNEGAKNAILDRIVKICDKQLKDQPWSLVRGKDLVNALASLVQSLPSANHRYKNSTVDELCRVIKIKIETLYSPGMGQSQSLDQALGEIARTDRSTYQYLLIP